MLLFSGAIPAFGNVAEVEDDEDDEDDEDELGEEVVELVAEVDEELEEEVVELVEAAAMSLFVIVQVLASPLTSTTLPLESQSPLKLWVYDVFASSLTTYVPAASE